MKRILVLVVCAFAATTIGCASARELFLPGESSLAPADAKATSGVVQTEYQSSRTADNVVPPSVLPAGGTAPQ